MRPTPDDVPAAAPPTVRMRDEPALHTRTRPAPRTTARCKTGATTSAVRSAQAPRTVRSGTARGPAPCRRQPPRRAPPDAPPHHAAGERPAVGAVVPGPRCAARPPQPCGACTTRRRGGMRWTPVAPSTAPRGSPPDAAATPAARTRRPEGKQLGTGPTLGNRVERRTATGRQGWSHALPTRSDRPSAPLDATSSAQGRPM